MVKRFALPLEVAELVLSLRYTVSIFIRKLAFPSFTPRMSCMGGWSPPLELANFADTFPRVGAGGGVQIEGASLREMVGA